MKLVSLVGQVFGRLTVLERAGSVGDKVCWLCRCTCGTLTKATSGNLKRGFVTSCGCYRREFIRGNQLPDGESGFNGLFGRYKRRAEEDGIFFDLTREEFRKLNQLPCHYCDDPPSQSISSRRSGRGRYQYIGIDRLDNSEGYTSSNCVPACKRCNYMKLEMSVAEFISACQQVSSKYNQKGACSSQAPLD